jgi:hypothetical protein
LDKTTLVDGAKLMFDIFADVSAQRESYHKVAHGIELIEWILENDRKSVEELIQYVLALLPEDCRKQTSGAAILGAASRN